MPGAAEELVREVREQLGRQADPRRAAGEKAYLHSELEFLGVTVPVIRSAVRAAARGQEPFAAPELREAVVALWGDEVHEYRMAAVELLRLKVDLLGAVDVDLLERLLRESRTWALVDGLATAVVGPVLERNPELGAVLDRWAEDDDLWLRRSALLGHLDALRRGEGSWEAFSRYADALLGDREFFVRKAVGWVLRDTARRRPELVAAWLLPRAGRAAGVTIREAVKPLSEADRAAILDARANGGPGQDRPPVVPAT